MTQKNIKGITLTGLTIILALWGITVGILWLLIGFRAVKAHEDLAKAQKEQTGAIKDYLKDLRTQKYLESKKKETE